MKYLKKFNESDERYSPDYSSEDLSDRSKNANDKFELLMDSILEVMDKFGIRCDDDIYDEDDNDRHVDYPYYSFAYNYNGTYRQINIQNLDSVRDRISDIVDDLIGIKPKLELRTGLKINIEYREQFDFIRIMPYISLFESFNLHDMLDKVDDISAYIPTHTSDLGYKWTLPNFNIRRILSNTDYSKYRGGDKSQYIRYYSFFFNDLSNFFKAESDIRNRCRAYGLKYFLINFNSDDRKCMMVIFSEEDWSSLKIEEVSKSITEDRNLDVLFEEDVIVDRDEFDTIYEDDEIMAIKPKTYRSAIKYAAGASWKSGLKKNQDWIDKYMTPGSYYGGTNWYKSTTVTKEVESWWRKLLKLPLKQSKVEIKEFFNDFPRYLFYIVIFKKLPIEDDMSKVYLLYDISRSEYGENPRPFNSDNVMFGSYWGDQLDAAHNQLRIVNVNSRKITLKDIHSKHGDLFNRAFREIESNLDEVKEKMYDLLGFWADKGGEYRDDALVFIRSTQEPDRLQITRPKLITKTETGMSWTRLGYYDDPTFDYWELDKKAPDEKPVPNNGRGFKGFFASMTHDIEKLKDALGDGWKL